VEPVHKTYNANDLNYPIRQSLPIGSRAFYSTPTNRLVARMLSNTLRGPYKPSEDTMRISVVLRFHTLTKPRTILLRTKEWTIRL